MMMMMMMMWHDIYDVVICVRVLSDEDGNINPYATFPFNRPAGSPPGPADTQRRPMTSRPDSATMTTSNRRPTRLETVRISYFDALPACAIYVSTNNARDRSWLRREEVKWSEVKWSNWRNKITNVIENLKPTWKILIIVLLLKLLKLIFTLPASGSEVLYSVCL